jgi:hypothetical protein
MCFGFQRRSRECNPERESESHQSLAKNDRISSKKKQTQLLPRFCMTAPGESPNGLAIEDRQSLSAIDSGFSHLNSETFNSLKSSVV